MDPSDNLDCFLYANFGRLGAAYLAWAAGKGVGIAGSLSRERHHRAWSGARTRRGLVRCIRLTIHLGPSAPGHDCCAVDQGLGGQGLL